MSKTTQLRILHLEDDPDYPALVRSLLAQEAIQAEVVHVASQAQFETALATSEFDVVLADYRLPEYDGLQALAFARQLRPEVPFLLVSGTIGEQAAIESLKAGARDYVLKLWPERLVPAIRRAVEEAQQRLQRIRAERDLARTEKYFRALTEHSLDIVAVLNRDGVLIYYSPSVTRLLGYSKDQLIGTQVFSLVHPEDVPTAKIALAQALTDPDRTVRLELRVRHADGSWRHLEVAGQNRLEDPEIAALILNARDISDRKRIEHRDTALSKLGQHLSAASSPADAARVIRAIADDLFRWDAFTLDLYSAEDDQVTPFYNVDTDRSGKRYELDLSGAPREPSGMARRVISNGAELILREPPLVMPADVIAIGEEHRPSASLMVVPIRNRTQVIGILSVQSYSFNAYDSHDLCTLQTLADYCAGALERIRTEQALRESEQRFRDLFEGSPDAIFVEDLAGNVLDVNPAACQLHGYSKSELIGKNVLDLVAPEIRDAVRDNLPALAHGGLRQLEGISLTRDGKTVPVEIRVNRIEYSGRPALLLHVRDLTERKHLEDQFRHAQKMEAIGRLAGGVAHDFNNLLTVIHGHASLLQTCGNLAANSARSAQQIVQAAERAAGLTRQLLAVSRRQVMQLRRLDLNDVVANMTKMLGRILGEDIALQLQYSPAPALIQADGGMMEQVLLNLVVNARDAMPGGGQLHIQIALRQLTVEHLPGKSGATPGPFVCLSVSDTGCGISPENLRRIFEPFFTTKEVGKGTGLGLATAYGIVKQHHGWIDVQSQLGRGSTFQVFLPAAPAGAAPTAVVEKPAAIPGGTETILVVEDEAPVRELVCNLLASHGYKTLQAETGVKALELWQQCKDEVDLVVTDLVMPDQINGRQLAEKLWAERPRLKVLFTSGYNCDVVGKGFVLERGLKYLQKPYPPSQLALAVRECLDAVN
jgi:PAS domain S-box-containing protein